MKTRRLPRLLALAVGGLAWGALPALAAELAFVHAEANVGGASGGHTALRLGDLVYHYQARDDRLLLQRESWELFRFRYGVLQNRPLHAAYVPAAGDELRRIRDGFAARYLAQRRALDALDAARRDVALLEAFVGEREGVAVPGAGLLDPGRPRAPGGGALRAQVAAERGAGFLDAEIARLEGELATAPLSPDAPRRHRERLALHAALVALRDAHDLDPDAVFAVDDADLSTAERQALEGLALRLDETILALLRSRRPDRGPALLTALARRHAVRGSLASGRLVLLDPYPDDPPRIEGREVEARAAELEALAEALAASVASARAGLVADPGEAAYQQLESVAARRREYARGARAGAPVREPEGPLLPRRSRALPHRVREAPADGVHRALADARSSVRRHEARFAAAWRYDLFTSNCVTELVRTLNDVLGEETRAVLGGRVEAGQGLGFIPFVFFDQVGEELHPDRTERLAPWRERAVDALGGWGPWVAAREATTLTSQIYRPRDADGTFLLFTDDAPAARPLFGAVNLAFAAGDAVVGILTAPFDRGDRLERAGRGLLFSLPELVFVNIRKGSFDAAGLRRTGADAARPRP